MPYLFLTLAALTAPLHTLLVAVPGPHQFGHALLLAIAGWLLALTWATQEAPEVFSVSPDYLEPASFGDDCAVPFCEHTERGCFCAEDCECWLHVVARGENDCACASGLPTWECCDTLIERAYRNSLRPSFSSYSILAADRV